MWKYSFPISNIVTFQIISLDKMCKSGIIVEKFISTFWQLLTYYHDAGQKSSQSAAQNDDTGLKKLPDWHIGFEKSWNE